MTERLWDKADEWVDFAPCVGDIDFIMAPEDLGADRTERVRTVCAGCPVRPECIVSNTAPIKDPIQLKHWRKSSSVWVAGVWLPDPKTAAAKRELEATRQALLENLGKEYILRPAGIL